MAGDNLLVTVSGAALSLLFYENVRSIGEQTGFLLGEAIEFIVKTHTDSDNQLETVKIHINVETIVTCPLIDLLHNSTGRVNKERLKDFICDKSKHVIGWFHFRRSTSSLILTMRDKILHKQFASHFSDNNNGRENLFLTCLLNASTSETGGTHKFRHVFLRHKHGIFEPIPLRINNLGDDAFRHDGSDYKPIPVRKSTYIPDGFTELIASLQLDMKTSGLDSAMIIQKAAERHLISLIPEVHKSDLEVAELERQICELKNKITTQQLNRKAKINGESYAWTSKSIKENCFLEKIDSSTKDELKIEDDMHLRREHLPSCAQSVTSNNRISCRNTAIYIAKSVNQEKTRRLERGNPQEDSNQQQNQQDISFTNRRPIPEIVTESICQEGNETSAGRGRGSGRGNHEFTGMKKTRRSPNTTQTRSTRERSITPEQDFSDAESSAATLFNSPVLR